MTKVNLFRRFLNVFRCRHRHLDFVRQRTEGSGTPFVRLECALCGAFLLKSTDVAERNFPHYESTRIELDKIIGF